MGDTARNVESQTADPMSMLHLARDVIALRKHAADLRTGSYAALPAPTGVWAWRRGDHHAVVVNLSDDAGVASAFDGRVLVGTDRARARAGLTRSFAPRAWNGCIAC